MISTSIDQSHIYTYIYIWLINTNHFKNISHEIGDWWFCEIHHILFMLVAKSIYQNAANTVSVSCYYIPLSFCLLCIDDGISFSRDRCRHSYTMIKDMFIGELANGFAACQIRSTHNYIKLPGQSSPHASCSPIRRHIEFWKGQDYTCRCPNI